MQEWVSFYRRETPKHLLTGSWHSVDSGRNSGKLGQKCALIRTVPGPAPGVRPAPAGLAAELWVPPLAAGHCFESWAGRSWEDTPASHV